MDDQTTSLLDWSFFCQRKTTDELTESLMITTMELEATRFKAQEDLKQKDEQLTQLKHLLNTTINEKNKYQTLLLNHHHQTTTPPPYSAVSSIEDEPITNTTFSSSDCEESIISSPEQEMGIPMKALPENGKFLEAVIKAGPLLQNLLLAGPLPHWRHPPPPVDIYRIPVPLPLVVPPTLAPDQYLFREFNKKRGLVEGSDSSTETKYQRIGID